MWGYICAIGITAGALFGSFKLGDHFATNRIEAAQQKVRADALAKSVESAPNAQAIAEQYAKSVATSVLAQMQRQHASEQAAIDSGLDRCMRAAGVRDLRNQAIARTHPSRGGDSAAATATGRMPKSLPASAVGSRN